MTFAQRRNLLTTHLSVCIPIVKRRISVLNKLHENQYSGSQVVRADGRTDRHNEVIVAFRNFGKAPINGYVSNTTRTLHQLFIRCKGKGKAVPLQAWGGPEGSRKLRFPDFMTTPQDCGKVGSLTHRPPLPPGNTPGTHFC